MDKPSHLEGQSDQNALTESQQRRNVAVYVVTNSLVYLAAPVVYVGITQATLCHELRSSDVVANLPSSAAFWGALLPLFAVWKFPQVSHIRPVLVSGYAAIAVGGLIVASSLYWPIAIDLQLAVIIVHGAVIGGALAVINAFLWEQVGRGIGPKYRGLAFGLAFGVGPLLAIVGSLGQQLILSGTVEIPWIADHGLAMRQFSITPLKFPLNFAALFAASSLILGLCALAATQYLVPAGIDELPSAGLWSNFAEVGRRAVSDRVLLGAVLAYLLVDAGATITNNMALYTPIALGQSAEDFAGYQNALRFSFKVIVGLLLGWAITRSHAKTGILATAGLCLGGMFWLLAMPSRWFLISFGLLGAGELYGVYFPNYIMTRSRPEQIRQNMALLQLLSLVTALAPPMFGAISDRYSLRASFIVASSVMGASLLIAVGLPARPQPQTQ